MNTDAPPPAPPRGPYRTNFGPFDGPILCGDSPGVLWIIAEGKLIAGSMAFPIGQAPHRRGPAANYCLVVNQVELEGRWLCVGREFDRLGDTAEGC